MKAIKLVPFEVSIIASDSMGVRSLATLVIACNKRIGVDLGASIAPRRYGLPPHELELKRLEEALSEIEKAVTFSDILIITHYHYDHYLKDKAELYYGKELFVKDYKKGINRSQAFRAKMFLEGNKVIEKSNVKIADGKMFRVGELELEFSRPVWHGEEKTKLGKLLLVKIACKGRSIIYGSDSQGPGNNEALEQLLKWRGSELLIISGPPTYFAGYKVSREAVNKGLENLRQVIENKVARYIVVDHHLLRDLNYKKALEPHYRVAEGVGVKVLTAAEFMGQENDMLEARRKELWKK
ncbi:MAG: hypothetical protein F7B61_02925 [Caldisphaeraceae archaeon]|nr:hypothetical protein [Caldisphaeraceae archaeon]